jgi:hypothetical protein
MVIRPFEFIESLLTVRGKRTEMALTLLIYFSRIQLKCDSTFEVKF